MRHRERAAAAAIVLSLAACARQQPGVAPTAAVSARNDLQWVRTSAEYRGIALEVYRMAADHLPATDATGWAVVLDVDETLLDNSLNELQLAERGETYNETEWAVWVRQRKATAVPGAMPFTEMVHRRGGKVIAISNRADSLCDATRDNLEQVDIHVDALLCERDNVSDKNPRFHMIEQGTAVPGLPRLRVVEWIGDNIQDFPNLTQAVREVPGGYLEFGRRYFLLPNPIYGSWQHRTP